jgi:hypothetical protein
MMNSQNEFTDSQNKMMHSQLNDEFTKFFTMSELCVSVAAPSIYNLI